MLLSGLARHNLRREIFDTERFLYRELVVVGVQSIVLLNPYSKHLPHQKFGDECVLNLHRSCFAQPATRCRMKPAWNTQYRS
jgi:hypothetical protein